MSDSSPRHLSRIYFTPPLSVGQKLELNAETLHYVRDVLRLKVGESFYAFDGLGGEYLSRIVAFAKKNGVIDIVEWCDVERESALHITLVQGIARGEKMDWIIQKAVELGVAVIQPVMTEHGNVRLSSERWQNKQAHWQAIAVHAAAQSGRTRVPEVRPPNHLAAVVEEMNHAQMDRAYVLSPHEQPGSGVLPSAQCPQTVVIYVGPEGGFSPTEMALFQRYAVPPWCLGKRVLRTETAPVTALSVLQFLYGDLKN